MALDYVTGVSIPFESNATAVLGGIAKATKALRNDITILQKQVDGLNASLLGMGDAAKSATADVTGLGAAMRSSSAAANSAAGASNRAAEGYANVGRAASSAASNIARLNALVTMTGGVSAASRAFTAASIASFVPPAIQRSGALAIPPEPRAALPAASMRFAGAQNAAGQVVASEEGWASSYYAGALGGGIGGGRRGGRGAGGGGIFGSGAYMRGGGYGGGRGYGGGGGGGGYGNDGLPPIGGGGIPRIPHAVVHAAKIGAEAALGLATDAVYEAAKLQTILVSTQNVTGANAAQMARVREAAFNVGDKTAMSPVQTAEMFRELSRQSQGSMSFDDMLGLLPQMAKMQVVLGAARGFTPHQTVDSTMALVHLFRAYDPKGQKRMMDTVLRMGELMPDNLNQAVRQLTYFEPTLKSLHVSDEDAASMMVAMSRFGMGKNKGGSSIQNLAMAALGPLLQTRHAQGGTRSLLENMGVLDAKGDSKFFTDKGGDLFGFLDQLYRYSQRVGSIHAARDFESVFHKTGSRVADLMADPVIVEQLHKIHDAIVNQKSLGLDSQSHTIFGTANFAFKRAWSDFQALATEVGDYALPGLTRGFNDLADGLHNAQVWLHKHREVAVAVQTDITNAVKGTERYIVGHKKDWDAFGGDIKGLADAAVKAGPDVKHLGDAIFGLMGTARSLGDALNKANAASQKAGQATHSAGQAVVQAALGITPQQQDAYNKWLSSVGGNVLNYDFSRAPGDLFRLMSPPARSKPSETPRRQHTREVVHHHGDTHIHIHDAHNPHETARQVKRVLDDRDRARARTPQHGLGRSGAVVTAPNLSNAVTVRH